MRQVIRLIRRACALASACLAAAAVLSAPALAAPGVQDVLPFLTVSPAGISGFATPLAHRNGAVYTINVEPAAGAPNGINLQTVVRKGVRQGAGYVWTQTVVEPRTLDDPYHNAGSIAVDRDGYIHIAYNMHNMPWQYAVSKRPEDISEFRFLGEPLTNADLGTVRYDNRTPFPHIGQAAIPGAQVTYPAFFYDRHKDLYVTYRFALKPKLDFPDRVYSGGLARYDVKTRAWTALGQPVALTPAEADVRSQGTQRSAVTFASTKGWWVNDPRLWFDEKNGMHMAWSWAEYGRMAMGLGSEPAVAYAYSPDGRRFYKSDGTPYALPIDYGQSEFVARGRGYEGTPHIALNKGSTGSPMVMLVPPRSNYHYVMRDEAGKRWTAPLPMPFNAQNLFVDDSGTAWAVATGPVVLASRAPQMPSTWRVVYKENGEWAHPKFLYLPEEKALLVHLTRMENFKMPANHRSNSQGQARVRIIRLELDRLRQ